MRYLSPEELRKIQRLSVGIAGAGGLGSNCAVMLVRSGFRNLTIVDDDEVDAGNLNRQSYDMAQIGRPKVAALAERLRRINPALTLLALRRKIVWENAGDIFSGCDVIVEALDRTESKTMLIEALANAGKFFVAASGIAGCGDSDRIKTRRINENFYVVGDLQSDVDQKPPLAPCVTIAAAKQADLVLAYALKK